MNEKTQKREIAFPIAAVFSAIAILVGLVRLIYYFYQLLANGVPLPQIFVGAIGQFVSLVSCILLTVVLFMRKRCPLLFVPLGIDLVLDFLSAFSNFSIVGRLPSWLLLSYVVSPVLSMANGVLFLLFAVFQDCKEESDAARAFRKIWFIPGIVSVVSYIFGVYQTCLGMIKGYTTILDLAYTFSGPLVSIPMAFLLGWWLTHPYKKEKPVYKMPVAQPYGQPCGQPLYQATGVSDTVQKVFCTGCGRELSPDENFCSVCGEQRMTPAQGAQPTFQQPVYPQMGYVQDAPSGGMTALGFFFPIVGLILYLVWKDQTPLKAKSAGKGALIGVIVWTALSVILVILAYVIPLLVFYSYY